MKIVLCLLFASLPSLTLGDGNISCGDHVRVTSPATYAVKKDVDTDCVVHFDRFSSGPIILTVSARNLDCTTCKVNVIDGDGVSSKTGGNICSYGYFSRTVKSDNLGELYLHVQGQCGFAGLRFTVKQSCSSYEFECGNFDCVRKSDHCDGHNDCSDSSDEYGCPVTVATYVGPAIAALILVGIVVGVIYRVRKRRVVLVRRQIVVPAVATHTVAAEQTVVAHSRW